MPDAVCNCCRCCCCRLPPRNLQLHSGQVSTSSWLGGKQQGLCSMRGGDSAAVLATSWLSLFQPQMLCEHEVLSWVHPCEASGNVRVQCQAGSHTHACCCTRRVPEGTVDVVLSYCHNSLHDTSLLKVCGGGNIGTLLLIVWVLC